MKKLCITAAKAVGFFVGWAVLTGLLPLPETENAAIWRFWAELIPFLSAAGWTVLASGKKKAAPALDRIAAEKHPDRTWSGIFVAWKHGGGAAFVRDDAVCGAE